MKKLFCILLSAVLVLSASACGLQNLKDIELPPLPQVTEAPVETPIPTVTPEVVQTPEPTETPLPVETPDIPAVQEEPLGLENQVIINFKHTGYEQFDPEEGTQRILTFAYDTPFVTIGGHAEAAAAINGQLAYKDEIFYTGSEGGENAGFNGMLEIAEDNYAYVRQSGQNALPLEYSATRGVRTARVDQRLVSLVFSYYEYTGGAHGSYAGEACVFDTQTGALLTLEDLSGDYEAMRKALVYKMVSLTESDPALYDHLYVSYIPDGDFYAALGKLLRQGSWYFDEKGMVVFSSLYELGPYAAGIAEFHIPYESLRGIIDDKWLPSERSGEGTLRAAAVEDGESAGLTFIDRIETDAQGQELCLIAEGNVYDVKLSRVYYSDRFYEDSELWFCSEIRDAALQLVTVIPEGIPNLMLSYTDAAGQRYSKLLTVSGLDGSFHLVDESGIEPVG